MSGRGDSAGFIALVQATAGATGGVFAAFVLMPLEVAKTRIQLSHGGDLSTFGTLAGILADEGCAGLFKGCPAKCFETGSKNFVYFYIYDVINAVAKRQVKLTTGVKLLLGYLAGVGNTIATMPLEVMATKVQAEKGNDGVFVLVKRVLDKEGVGGLFKGFWYNIMLCVNPAIQNTCFDKVKDWIMKAQVKNGVKSPALSAFQAFLLGAFAKAIATIITYPLVRLKTILQAGQELARKVSESSVGPPFQRTSSKEMLLALAEREDKLPAAQGPLQKVAELYRGIGSALMKSVLQAAFLYMTRDQVAGFVRTFFKLSAKAFFRKDGTVKLGVFSGRPLAS
eukprot:CAMPEP_0203863562 /NCGR_PEP_ID=MMETSP0359-20131031/14240_1 /ASSEMBLY_ACC=CAM_ASM_000338 /TAXON_ID=268821 /ORGANISM="Scrippsiella Hangoei, Strain SHTV-5" /LENGTH=338 /DNA_ID=CAMNT_0050781131 /DNA_START=78 /DNA_END=1094 /DNA_ORIENTATION=-